METKIFNPKTVNPATVPEKKIQAKLEVTPPHDEYEQESDKVTDKVSRMPGNPTNNIQMLPASVDNSIASMPLEEAIKSLPNIPPDQTLLVLKRYQQFIIRRITSGEGRIRDLMSLRAESFSNYLIGGTIEVFGGTSLPSNDWAEAWQHVNAAYSTLSKQQVKKSLDSLNFAADATNRQWEQLNKYLDQTEKGADRSIFALQVMQAAGAVAATALTGGGATAIVVGAGYGAAQNLAGQATAVSIGIQSKIDWGGLAFDTLFGVLTGALGGKLGNTILKKLMGNKAVASLGRRVVSEVVSDLVSGRLSSILQTTARSLFDQLRGKENLTIEQFLELLADQLMDPKAMFLDAIMGRASKMAHKSSSKTSGKAASKSSASVSEPPTKTPVHEPIRSPTGEPTVAKPMEPVQTVEPVLTKAAKSTILEVPVANATEPGAPKPAEIVKTPITEKVAEQIKSSTIEDLTPAILKEDANIKNPSADDPKGLVPDTTKSGPRLPEAWVGEAEAKLDSSHPMELGVSEKRSEQIRSGEKNFAIDRALTFDIDEVLPVGAADIKPQRAVKRARDPYNRQLLDPNTNQRTKGLGIDVRELRENRGEQKPVSVVDNPSALITKRFSEVHELKRIFDRAVASVKEPQKLKPTELKARINKETRRIITEDTGPDAIAVRKALASLGFEHQPGRGFTMMKEPQP